MLPHLLPHNGKISLISIRFRKIKCLCIAVRASLPVAKEEITLSHNCHTFGKKIVVAVGVAGFAALFRVADGVLVLLFQRKVNSIIMGD